MNHLKTFRQFIKEEDGMGTVEVILIIVENRTIRYTVFYEENYRTV